MMYDLPKQLEIDGELHDIRSDYRAALDIIAALNDPELSNREKNIAVILILYPEYAKITNAKKAIDKAMWFLAGGRQDDKSSVNILYDWEQDFPLIVSPVNRVLGKETRDIPYDPKTNTGGLHWWTFLSAFYEVGDCSFAYIVSIRDKLKKGKKLEKYEQQFYRENKNLIDLNVKASNEEQALIDEILQNNL